MPSVRGDRVTRASAGFDSVHRRPDALQHLDICGPTTVNLIAMGAAGYRFGDHSRLGLVVMVVFFVVAVFVVPIVWPF